MAIGPVQLIVLGFEHPEFHGEIIAELERLRESDTVRVIDALAVYKDADGEIEVEHLSNLIAGRGDRARQQGRRARSASASRARKASRPAPWRARRRPPTASQVFSDEDAWDVLEDIPNDSAAALVLIEHHWAVPLRDAVVRAGGFRIATASSARSTSSRSAWSPPRRPSSCTPTRPPARPPHADPRHRGDTTCSDHAESPAAPAAAPPAASHAATSERRPAAAGGPSCPSVAGRRPATPHTEAPW